MIKIYTFGNIPDVEFEPGGRLHDFDVPCGWDDIEANCDLYEALGVDPEDEEYILIRDQERRMNMSMYVIFTHHSPFAQDIITEDILEHFDLREDTPEEREAAKAEGYRFAHLFRECEGDYGEVYYEFVASEIIL